MVLQVRTHSRSINQHLNAMLFQMGSRANARQHQDLRRPEGTCRQNDRATGADRPALTALADAHTRCPTLFDNNFFHLRAGFNVQAACRLMGEDIGPRCRPAFPLFLRHLIDADAFQLFPVEIGIARQL